ncbi:MAG: helix-turn-helix transcriptional regulator [Bacteroidota bacterium]
MRSLPPRGFDAPIAVRDGYYTYEDPDFTIENTNLSESDIETINNAITLLSQFKKLTIHEELAVVREKLRGEILQQGEQEQVIEFEKKEVKGSELLAPLFKAITKKQAIRLDYKPFRSERIKDLVIHPYFLKQFNHRWYLLGFCQKHQNIGIYSLDRIENWEITKEKYIENDKIDPETYFKDIIGVTIPENEEIQEIIIKADNRQLPYIKTKPLHHSQQIIEENESGMTVQLKLIPNYEFYSLILSYGDSVEILAPQKVREEMKGKVGGMAMGYKR